MVEYKGNVARAALIAAAAFAAISLPVAAQTVTFEPGTSFQTAQISGFQTTGADMVGMMVTLNGGLSAAWGNLGGGKHGVIFGSVEISMIDGQHTGGPGIWNVIGDSSNPVNSIKFAGAPGRTVFDAISAQDEGTPGSATGSPILVVGWNSFPGPGSVTGIYSNLVSITGQAPVGDLYEQLTINFSGGLTGTLDFKADTDNSPFGVPITAVPEPGTIGMMLAGLAGVSLLVRRRQRKS
jgi:PEP-CTERM motif